MESGPPSLPLHETLRHEQWRRMILNAGPKDFEGLQQMALQLLNYAVSHRLMLLNEMKRNLPKRPT